jgi:hypothetical protein
MRRKARKSL